MNEQELKQTIIKILDDHQIGTMATIANQRPHSRYMTFFHDNFTLYTATSKDTHKVDDLRQNPYVHIIIGYSYEGIGDQYLEIEGQCELHDEPLIKDRLWNDKLKHWFSGPEDPNYLVLKITPSEFHLKNTNDHQNHRYKPTISD
ncbi:pyridoxamine 5'-phosphate oxidase family protein [Amphibacillus jilinensis]|uniref:pyridoxamine 5'-phosphate oxidase family protein n=1 Tax=Amphibacillus jilinensis TaxID=1216008 RepID=UPI0002DC0238|nr:pyridoxamine 5'-phosphate oxidase family protein [Amphibacillus jilinensis]